jgi:hypothetical protein
MILNGLSSIRWRQETTSLHWYMFKNGKWLIKWFASGRSFLEMVLLFQGGRWPSLLAHFPTVSNSHHAVTRTTLQQSSSSIKPVTRNRNNMTLTVVVGASGSGKTTFLNDGTWLRLFPTSDTTIKALNPCSLCVRFCACAATVAKQHQCTYIRQYHGIRPYIAISKIPRFDSTKLRKLHFLRRYLICIADHGAVDSFLAHKITAYWSIYEREKTASTIKAGGTMAGNFTGTYKVSL